MTSHIEAAGAARATRGTTVTSAVVTTSSRSLPSVTTGSGTPRPRSGGVSLHALTDSPSLLLCPKSRSGNGAAFPCSQASRLRGLNHGELRLEVTADCLPLAAVALHFRQLPPQTADPALVGLRARHETSLRTDTAARPSWSPGRSERPVPSSPPAFVFASSIGSRRRYRAPNERQRG